MHINADTHPHTYITSVHIFIYGVDNNIGGDGFAEKKYYVQVHVRIYFL